MLDYLITSPMSRKAHLKIPDCGEQPHKSVYYIFIIIIPTHGEHEWVTVFMNGRANGEREDEDETDKRD